MGSMGETETVLKQLVVLSGKGGTGKTTVAAALAHLASQDLRIVLADADVDLLFRRCFFGAYHVIMLPLL